MGKPYMTRWYSEVYNSSGALVAWGRSWTPNYWAATFGGGGNTFVQIMPTVETAALRGGGLVDYGRSANG